MSLKYIILKSYSLTVGARILCFSNTELFFMDQDLDLDHQDPRIHPDPALLGKDCQVYYHFIWQNFQIAVTLFTNLISDLDLEHLNLRSEDLDPHQKVVVPENGTGILRRTHLQFLTKFFSNFLILLAEVLILLQQCLNRKVVSQTQTNK
jgi:hypothetical protein